MFPEPPEDSDRTIFCQTCGNWRHPRHSCARDTAHETAPLSVMLLRRNGPTCSDVFSGTSYEAKRKHDVGKLELTAHSRGKRSVFGKTKAVYYLVHEHPPADVIETWLEVNRDRLRDRELTTESVTRALTKRVFKDAWVALRNEREFDFLDEPNHSSRGGDHLSRKTCPFCGDEVMSLPGHLPCDGDSDG